MPAMVPFFIIDMLMGLPSPARASAGSEAASAAPISGVIISPGLTSIFAMPLLALNHAPVPLTFGKYFVNASLRCSCAASILRRALRTAILFWRARVFNCSKDKVFWAAMKLQHAVQRMRKNILFILSMYFFVFYFKFTFQYTTGSMVTTRMREPMPPAKMVTPTGIQNDDCAMIIGTTPTAVVAVVRKIGTMRRRPAS